MKNIIAFSLWGDNPKYTIGAIKNAELLERIYPGWIARFYVGSSVPNMILFNLETHKNVEILHESGQNNWSGMFWRFKAATDPEVSIAIFRDTDSRINAREKAAVDQWLLSDKTFHIMRDHPHHKFPILGGMWGIKNNGKYNLKDSLEHFCNHEVTNGYGTDYTYLANNVYPLATNDSIIHDEFFGGLPFPTSRIGADYVGKPFESNDLPSLPQDEKYFL